MARILRGEIRWADLKPVRGREQAGLRPPAERITIRASKDVVSQIDALAAGMDRSRNYVGNQAIQQYLAYHHVLHPKIEQGLNDAKDGRLTAADDVMKEIRAHRARRRT